MVEKRMKYGAVIVAAGRGERLGYNMPKCLVKVGGRPLVMFAFEQFMNSPSITEIVVVVCAENVEELQAKLIDDDTNKTVHVVAGGDLRQDSVRKGVKALSPAVEKVLIHDGARPLIGVDEIENVCLGLRTSDAVFLAHDVIDTTHRLVDGKVAETLDRSELVSALTPQGFDRETLNRAFVGIENSGDVFTDEVDMVRKICGARATPIRTSSMNNKITTATDLKLFELILSGDVIEL